MYQKTNSSHTQIHSYTNTHCIAMPSKYIKGIFEMSLLHGKKGGETVESCENLQVISSERVTKLRQQQQQWRRGKIG